VKIIILLRNPVDRAYSHYNHVVKKGPEYETLTFAEAIEAETDRLRGEQERILSEGAYNSVSYQHHSYLAKGIYADQIVAWSKYFSLDQMLILIAEELFLKPAQILEGVFSFLALPDQRISDLSVSNPGSYVDMDKRLRNLLVEYYRPHNARLYEFIGRRLDWDR